MGEYKTITAGAASEAEFDGRDMRAVENERFEAFISDLAKRLAAQPPSVRDWRRSG